MLGMVVAGFVIAWILYGVAIDRYLQETYALSEKITQEYDATVKRGKDQMREMAEARVRYILQQEEEEREFSRRRKELAIQAEQLEQERAVAAAQQAAAAAQQAAAVAERARIEAGHLAAFAEYVLRKDFDGTADTAALARAYVREVKLKGGIVYDTLRTSRNPRIIAVFGANTLKE